MKVFDISTLTRMSSFSVLLGGCTFDGLSA